MNKNKAIK